MKYKLLIVEDEIMIRQGLICAVDWKTMGITEIQEASNGAEGVEKVKSFHPDIVITDICMPIVSGLDLIKQTVAEYHYIPIIISGYSDFEYAQTAIEFGVTAFLLKPIDIEKLQEAVEKAKVELYKQNLLKDYSASRQDFIHASYIPARGRDTATSCRGCWTLSAPAIQRRSPWVSSRSTCITVRTSFCGSSRKRCR